MARFASAALSSVVRALCCPGCGGDLQFLPPSLRCWRGHSFDLARAGYVNLLPGKRLDRGDTEAMIRARERVLSSGLFRSLDRAIGALLPKPTGVVVELGAGTAHHLAEVVAASPEARGLAVDLSRAAATSAARRHPRISSVIADVEARVPLRTGAADAILCAFAPRPVTELARCLRPGGALVIARAGPRHLEGLERPVRVDPHKETRLRDRLNGAFIEEERIEVLKPVRLAPQDAQDLIAMGPSAFHLRGSPTQAAATRVALHFVVSRHRKSGADPLPPARRRSAR